MSKQEFETIYEETGLLPEGVINVYRTPKHIVEQSLGAVCTQNGVVSLTISLDVFYVRTPKRDREFARWIKEYPFGDGKRVKTSMSTRRYVK